MNPAASLDRFEPKRAVTASSRKHNADVLVAQRRSHCVEQRVDRTIVFRHGSAHEITFNNEPTAIGDRDVRFVDVVTLYLRTLRLRACDNAKASLDSVVIGRPVRFVDDDAERDREAQETLADCARSAGFRHVEFQLEPIAAAFDYERTIAHEEVVLVIDVGGGTADFTVIRLAPTRTSRVQRTDDVLANDGVHIAGTDFDARLNLS